MVPSLKGGSYFSAASLDSLVAGLVRPCMDVGEGERAEASIPCSSPFTAKRMMGLEPTTFCMASRRSSQLSYIRARAKYSPAFGPNRGAWTDGVTANLGTLAACGRTPKVA
jgi:hypothetical protein